MLRGFDCVQEEYPENVSDVTPGILESRTGLSISALTPKQRTTYWRLAGIALCTAEFAIGESIGVDPVFTLIPATLLLLLSDQLFYNGAAFETIYRTLFPEFRRKVICHEAGHFLVAYLLGLPVRGCITSAWEARKYPGIKGQAGTIFFDPKIDEEVKKQRVTRRSLDRISVVTMAGIAAEALQFGNCEGGSADEQALIRLFSQISPPWNIVRIQGQARWAVVQALGLIKEHKASYDAAVAALEAGKGVGDVVLAIEANLPTQLPAAGRIQERAERKRKIERDALIRYVQKMTWSVGGMEEPAVTTTLSTTTATTATDTTAVVPTIATTGGMPAPGKDYCANASPGCDADNGTTVQLTHEVAEQGEPQQEQQGAAVAQFAQRMRMLEQAIRSGDLDLHPHPDASTSTSTSTSDPAPSGTGKPNGTGGAVSTRDTGSLWLNGLQSLKQGVNVDLESVDGVGEHARSNVVEKAQPERSHVRVGRDSTQEAGKAKSSTMDGQENACRHSNGVDGIEGGSGNERGKELPDRSAVGKSEVQGPPLGPMFARHSSLPPARIATSARAAVVAEGAVESVRAPSSLLAPYPASKAENVSQWESGEMSEEEEVVSADVKVLLQGHRGYQIKQLELLQAEKKRQVGVLSGII